MSRGHEIVIEARGLTRRFGSLVAVDGFDLDVYRGEVFGFLGSNGAGKSTLIRMMVGLLTPSEGGARVLGLEIPDQAEELRSRIGYMTQKFSLYDDLSVAENLEFAAEIFGLGGRLLKERVEEALEGYGLVERRNQRPATLSGGWRQRLALAVATVHEPELLFLDEPTAGVDPESRREFWSKLFELAQGGTTILVSTHYMDEAVRCHRLCMVRDGRRAALGAPDDLMAALAGRTVEISADPPAEVIRLLGELPEVVSVSQMGNDIHALLVPGAPSAEVMAERFVATLEAASFGNPRAAPVEPQLEDVFVALLRGEKMGEGYDADPGATVAVELGL